MNTSNENIYVRPCLFIIMFKFLTSIHTLALQITHGSCQKKPHYFLKSTYLGPQTIYAEVCDECFYTKLWVRKLNEESLNHILSAHCMTAKYLDDNKNCYQIFQRRKLCLNEEDIDDLFLFQMFKDSCFSYFVF